MLRIFLLYCFINLFVATSVYGYQTNSWLDFNGSSDYIFVKDSANLDIYQDKFTISVWLFPRNLTNNVLPRIIEKRSSYIAIMGNASNSRFGKPGFEMQNQTGTNTVEFWSNLSLRLNEWQHIVFVYDGNNGNWYINGKDIGTKSLYIGGLWSGREQNTSGYDLYIGRRRSDLSRNFNGKIDEMRVYNRNLSALEIKETYLVGRNKNTTLKSNGLVLWYSFDEGSGNSLYDSSPYKNNGTIYGAIWESNNESTNSSEKKGNGHAYGRNRNNLLISNVIVNGGLPFMFYVAKSVIEIRK